MRTLTRKTEAISQEKTPLQSLFQSDAVDRVLLSVHLLGKPASSQLFRLHAGIVSRPEKMRTIMAALRRKPGNVLAAIKSLGAIHGALRSCHRCRRGSVVLLFRHHGPKTTCHFVRQCNGDAHAGFALQHAYQPAVVRRSKSLNGLKNGHSLPGSACLHA